MQQEAYSPKEVAKLLGCHWEKIIRLIKTGKLKAMNLGTDERPRYHVTRGMLEAFYKENSYEPDGK